MKKHFSEGGLQAYIDELKRRRQYQGEEEDEEEKLQAPKEIDEINVFNADIEEPRGYDEYPDNCYFEEGYLPKKILP